MEDPDFRQINHQKKQMKEKVRVSKKAGWCAELIRTQCYLGLRVPPDTVQIDLAAEPSSRKISAFHDQDADKPTQTSSAPVLDVTRLCTSPNYKQPVLISFDLEWYERDANRLTEIGISTLDTNDIREVAPGKGGSDWMKHIRSRHFRIAEYAHLLNERFVSSCPDKFESKFGISEWISIKDVPRVIASCFKAPFSAPGNYYIFPSNRHEVPRDGFKDPALFETHSSRRNIIVIGHSVSQDVRLLRKAGYDLSNLSTLLEVVDTANMYRAFKRKQNPTSLANLLYELEIDAWNLHNAGNDAAYTLQALLGMAVAALAPHALTLEEAHLPLKDLNEDSTKSQDKKNEEEWITASAQSDSAFERIVMPSDLMPKSDGQGIVGHFKPWTPHSPSNNGARVGKKAGGLRPKTKTAASDDHSGAPPAVSNPASSTNSQSASNRVPPRMRRDPNTTNIRGGLDGGHTQDNASSGETNSPEHCRDQLSSLNIW